MAPPMDPNAAAEADGPPLTELESLQLKANQVTDESLESTRRMIALCEDVSWTVTWVKSALPKCTMLDCTSDLQYDELSTTTMISNI